MTTDKEVLHTQGEWKVIESRRDIEVCSDIYGINIIIARIPQTDEPKLYAESKANAELICKAVNERQRLLDSNKELQGYADYAKEVLESREMPLTFEVWKSYNKKETGWQTGPYGIID